jgi:hypothetical protein
MQFLLLGMVVLLLLLLATRAYTLANPQMLARHLRLGAGVAALAGAALLVMRGMAGYAVSLAALGSWLLWGAGGAATPAHQPRGQVSRVVTAHLEVELDHDSGAISGRVLRGSFAGRDLQGLTPAETARLWEDCRFLDPQSAQILEAYLDRRHPSWREDLARAEGKERAAAATMTRAQALQVLGLEEGAGEEEIRRAHRELMLKLHPDRGGSSYLAAQINAAKEVLLDRHP